jgi:hypothetical protein
MNGSDFTHLSKWENSIIVTALTGVPKVITD